MTFTEEDALRIAETTNCGSIPTSNGVFVMPPNFTRVLNLAAAEALDTFYEHQIKNGEWGIQWQVDEIAKRFRMVSTKYRAAAQESQPEWGSMEYVAKLLEDGK